MAVTKQGRTVADVQANARAVFNAWNEHQSLKETHSCWTDGEHIYSYDEPLVVWNQRDSAAILNRSKYGFYVAQYQTDMEGLLNEKKMRFYVVTTAQPGHSVKDIIKLSRDGHLYTPDYVPETEAETTELDEIFKPKQVEANPLFQFNSELGF
jgi:hypothetical protein